MFTELLFRSGIARTNTNCFFKPNSTLKRGYARRRQNGPQGAPMISILLRTGTLLIGSFCRASQDRGYSTPGGGPDRFLRGLTKPRVFGRAFFASSSLLLKSTPANPGQAFRYALPLTSA